MRPRLLFCIFPLLLLAGCIDEAPTVPPAPVELTRDATGYFCSMTVSEHPGPKGQIFLKRASSPIWFSSVRDTVAFTILPEESADIAAIYVSDMGRAVSWDRPGADNWINAYKAYYVIGSTKRGGMGAPEAVPFAERTAATDFALEFGGTVMAFNEIPKDAVLGMMDFSPAAGVPVQSTNRNGQP